MDKRTMNGVIFPIANILDENTMYCQKWVSISEINRTFTDTIAFVIVDKGIVE